MAVWGCSSRRWGKWEAPHIWRTDPDDGLGLISGCRRFQPDWFQMCSAPQPVGERQEQPPAAPGPTLARQIPGISMDSGSCSFT